MHVLILPSYYPSPERPVTGIFFHEQARALKKAGHQVGVLVTPRLDVTRAYLKRVGLRNAAQTSREHYFSEFPVYRMHWGWFPRPFPPLVALLIRQAGFRAFELYCAEQGRPEVIHAHNIFYGGYLAAQIGQKYGIPVVLTEHSTSYMEGLIIFPGQPQIIRSTLRKLKVRLAVSEALAAAIRPYAPEQPIGVIGNIVDTDFFTPDAAALASDFTFSVIGTLEPRKRQALLLEAFAAQFKGQPVFLRVGGEGATRPKLEAQAAELGVTEQVVFLGRLSREQVRDELHRCHALVSCSLVESFGVTLVEALACGKPVIATRSGGPESFVRPEDGLLIPTEDVQALARALQSMRDGYAAYNAENIRAACVERFGEAAIVRSLSEAYLTARGANVKPGL
ncbi:MAG: glycosyltransferase [Chloroflexota bacterium]